ncbi:TetR family transcriptional regulator [Mycolicibacterium conceptionense]|uniref:TetR family transcriptional regulator n=1 Tax=Mycolicibacterium conceptionense TaxID=451644 RepID=A0A0U1DHB8_9MYCO|nr:TetR/AcrR family transcriptional regulator [Mycolicibacterium conceptionense]ORV24645.1 hypothetical protein AWB98_20585 [Mycolicibacterium conceptionense]CQD16570.1 TetR family transcriptional regulator [Mycolicibacterium conceptionense]
METRDTLDITPWGPIIPAAPATETAARILDAARARFATQGITRTTMSELAADAGISRKWLYRHFDNRDAVVRALIGRDAQRVIDSVTALYTDANDPLGAMIDALTTVVELLREDQLLRRLVETEPQALAPFLTTGAATLMRPAIEVTVGLLEQHFEMASHENATVTAEALIRLTLSAVLSEAATTDFDDPGQRRQFFAIAVSRLIVPPHTIKPS